jgi:hypothetical protein
MDMMMWLFDTAPRVALLFVHVSRSEWSTYRTHVADDDVSHEASEVYIFFIHGPLKMG